MNNRFIWKCAFASVIRTRDIKMGGQYKLDNTVFFIEGCYLLFPHSFFLLKDSSLISLGYNLFSDWIHVPLSVVTLNQITFLQLSLDFSELRIPYCNAVKSQSAALQSFSISNDWAFVFCVICRALRAWDKV